MQLPISTIPKAFISFSFFYNESCASLEVVSVAYVWTDERGVVVSQQNLVEGPNGKWYPFKQTPDWPEAEIMPHTSTASTENESLSNDLLAYLYSEEFAQICGDMDEDSMAEFDAEVRAV